MGRATRRRAWSQYGGAWLLAVAVWLAGCSTGAKPGGMAPSGPLVAAEVGTIDAARAAEVPTLTLRTTGGRATNRLHTSQISDAAFREALMAELLRSGAFRPVLDQVADYHLHVHLAEVQQPFWGWLDMEVRIDAEWSLYEVETGRLVWERLVRSAHTATGEDSGFGIKRLRLANEGSARENIAEGVWALERLSLDRPR